MKHVRTMFLALAFTSATAAAQPDKQAPAEVTPNEARVWMSLFEKVVEAVISNREDCGKMATSLHGVIDANKDAIGIARDAKAKGKRLPPTAQQQMAESARRMVAALDKCGRDQAVGSAFRRLDLGGRK